MILEGFWQFVYHISAPDGRSYARASSVHTNLTRRIDPHDPEGLRSLKLKKSGCQISDIFLITCSFFMFFFEKVDLIWPLWPIPHVEKTRKWILSLWAFHLKSGIWTVFTSRSSIFLMKSGFSFQGFRNSILFTQGRSRIVISSKYGYYIFRIENPHPAGPRNT